MTAAATLRRGVRSGLAHVVVLVSWSAVYLVVLLAAIAGIIKVASGWDAVVVTSGSMAPTLRSGDVIFVDEHPDTPLGQNAVITFERGDGELVTHRIFEARVGQGTYVTKGDANPTPDAEPVPRDRVVGVGRLVLPYLGLPVVWMAEGDLIALVGLGVLVVAAMAAVTLAAWRGRETFPESDHEYSSAAQRGIGRVRAAVAVMIAMQLVVDNRQFELDAVGLSRFQTLTAALVGLAVVGGIAALRSRAVVPGRAGRLAMAELVGDTFIVVFFVAASGSSGIGWILMALPIIEAAIHFRLTGAFVHWMLMSGLTVAAFLATNLDAPASQMVADLEQLVDRLGVLLLVVIPGSYLAEQLLGEVLRQRRATLRARERSRLMERVTEAGHDITRLGGDLFETLLAATADIGFEVSDVWAGHPERGWQRMAFRGPSDRSLPAPGAVGSALRAEDLDEPEVAIDADDPDPQEHAAIAAGGLDAVARITLASSSDVRIVLRAGTARLDDDASSQVMALRLLCGQASVALQNERLLDELRSTHGELEHQAMYDALTGLANRAQFVSLLRSALQEQARGADRPTTLMFLDLNGFKAVNDRLGHNAGDELLVGVAGRLVSAIGDRGFVARLGGDEFTVLVDERCEPSIAEEIADAVHVSLLEPFAINGEQVQVGASVGIAHAEPGIGESEMLRRADVAMYAAKSMSGSWRTVTYSAEFDEQERRHGRLARAFKTALDRDELDLAYQPIVDAPTGAVVGAEALLRWTHPELGPVPPPTILNIAELTGMVSELNRWVLHTALAGIAPCRSKSGAPLFVAVNVSPEELELDSLCDNMRAAIAAAGLSPRRVVVELSERIVAQARGSDENVDRLIGMGLDLALDDFGEGQTALAHLRGLPIRFLKLDRLFIEHAGESAEDRKILASVVALAHELGFSVIAEGIETDEQRAIVLDAGADLLQGYGLHRPMPIAAFHRLIERADETLSPVWAGSEPLAGSGTGARHDGHSADEVMVTGAEGSG